MRKNGILMHISSLPSSYGIGKLGDGACAFVDFLADSGVQAWQILPLTPTSYGDSPYQSFSVNAGNPYFIDFERLEAAGYLLPLEYKTINWGTDPRRVDYVRVYNYCFRVLHMAFSRFDQTDKDYQKFLHRESVWLEDYALFMALKDANDGKPWYQWEQGLAMQEPEAMREAKKKYADDVAFYSVLQYWFYQQWYMLKSYCNGKNIALIGDIPIYAAYDSVDVWAHPELFQLDDTRTPKVVAGCPPDEFSETGQLWGNPIYDWDYHRAMGYGWWIDRLARATTMYDTVRIDHFRGFESYYAVPFGMTTAEIGLWQPGPGRTLFDAVERKLGNISIIAEDLGFVTPQVCALLQYTGFPGMKVLQFAFDGDAKNEYLPQNFETTHCVAYTGTHDNMTLRGWVQEASTQAVTFAKRYLHCRNVTDLPNEIIRAVWSSTAELAVAQMQDFLDVGADGRMNTPSTVGSNWQYRTLNTDFTGRLAKWIFHMNELYNRLPEMPKCHADRSLKRKSNDRVAIILNERIAQQTVIEAGESVPRGAIQAISNQKDRTPDAMTPHAVDEESRDAWGTRKQRYESGRSRGKRS